MRLFRLISVMASAAGAADAEMVFLPADSPHLAYSDHVQMTLVDSPRGQGAKMARFDRRIDMPGKGYRWDNPGARLRFRTDAAAVTVHLYYNDKHISTSARNPVGVYLIDGKGDPAWTFTSTAKTVVRAPEEVSVELRVPAVAGMREFDIVMPYGDSVDVIGVSVSAGAKFAVPEPRPKLRCAMYGDSITHGFTASTIAGTYAYQVAAIKGWQLVNLGLGGRASTVSDGELVGSLGCDVVTVLISANDWQGGAPVDACKKRIEGFLLGLRGKQPSTPVYLITPLWVPPSWQPEKAITDLEAYRQALREVVAASADPNLKIIEGPDLIDHDPKNFDVVAVHPNDAGFTMMAERLAKALR
jgi:lysophospholipase L1-like esterase